MIASDSHRRSNLVMEKIIINLEVPAISQKYDVLINPDMSVEEITELLCKVVEDVSNHAYVSSGSEILCLAKEQMVLRRVELFSRYNIEKGDHLLML